MLDKKKCAGCEDDFYNGKNPYGVQQCWGLETAKLVERKLIPIWQQPPYNKIPLTKVPNCYKQKGYSTVKPESLDSKGYWKG